MDIAKQTIINSSINARIALGNGEAPLSILTKDEILFVVKQYLIEEGYLSMDAINMLNEVTEPVLQEFLLKKTQWHHVNFAPSWFYELNMDVINRMTVQDIRKMISVSKHEVTKQKKLILVNTVEKRWETFGDKHQKTFKSYAIGVSYEGNVYFMDGSIKPICKDTLEVLKECKSKAQRQTFRKILHIMQTKHHLPV